MMMAQSAAKEKVTVGLAGRAENRPASGWSQGSRKWILLALIGGNYAKRLAEIAQKRPETALRRRAGRGTGHVLGPDGRRFRRLADVDS